ncbi:carboxymuconolactone decarboxylase family protein [Rugosimonospora africana]|uniref:Alkyl hydroperoxide reductase AhpD n=1 Tax=Rugosimonospora africana TaxID=556532 RepID=A0A8J3VSG2_9ACTN|nr:carboxymuconolactone decarboxylase family protein [Rugosimonospora africana]GIH17200.1 alkyl hydroperoxide reductase AhpD [Rugosimonospora africana]
MSIRHVSPVPRKAATGLVAEVYAQSTADFGQVAFMMMSPAPDLHAAAWALLREAELVGHAPRADKEVVTVAVSQANECRFCVDAHTIMIHATGEHRLAEDLLHGRPLSEPYDRLAAWARATRTPGAAQLREPPFPAEQAAEFLGTALSTHFTNRMFSVLTDERLIPGNLQRSPSVRRVGGMTYAHTVRRELAPGESLALLTDVSLGPAPGWAAGTPIGVAFAALRGAATVGGALLSETSREILRATVADWDGTQPASGWLDARLAGVPATDRPAARIALFSALAPHEISDADVAAWRTATDGTDGDLVRLLGFAAITVVDRIEEALAPHGLHHLSG